jgi:hypothetical protein
MPGSLSGGGPVENGAVLANATTKANPSLTVETITRNREAPIVSSANFSGVLSLWWPRGPTWETIPATAPGAVETPRFLVIVSSHWFKSSRARQM